MCVRVCVCEQETERERGRERNCGIHGSKWVSFPICPFYSVQLIYVLAKSHALLNTSVTVRLLDTLIFKG